MIANGSAGTAETAAVDAALGVLATRAPVRLCRTASLEELDEAFDLAEEDAVVVVAGGDGSLHCVVDRLRHKGVLAHTVLGLVPLGTGNDFARGLGLPLDPSEAARQLVVGSARRFDLLVDDKDGIVVNAVHAGLGAVAAGRAESMKERLGALAYPLGALLAGAREEGWELRVSVDDEQLDLPGERVLMVGVGNGSSIGGGTVLCPAARPDDGRLEVMVSTATGPLARVGFGKDLKDGRHGDRDDVLFASGTTVTISGDPVGYNADGELEDDVTDRSYRVEPGAWTLIS